MIVIEDINQPEFIENVVSPEIFKWSDVEHLLNAYYYNGTAVIKNGIKKDIPWVEAWWEGYYQDRAFIYNEVKNGAGIVLERISSYNKEINSICAEIEKTTQSAVDVHAYCGLEYGRESFAAHQDSTFNFIVQLDGFSEWTVYEEDTPTDTLTPQLQTILKPGDILYIPRQRFHLCKPQSKRLSLSFAGGPVNEIEINRREYYNYE